MINIYERWLLSVLLLMYTCRVLRAIMRVRRLISLPPASGLAPRRAHIVQFDDCVMPTTQVAAVQRDNARWAAAHGCTYEARASAVFHRAVRFEHIVQELQSQRHGAVLVLSGNRRFTGHIASTPHGLRVPTLPATSTALTFGNSFARDLQLSRRPPFVSSRWPDDGFILVMAGPQAERACRAIAHRMRHSQRQDADKRVQLHEAIHLVQSDCSVAMVTSARPTALMQVVPTGSG
jgi:hypothetical protein